MQIIGVCRNRMVGHPANSPLTVVCAMVTTVVKREASTLLATLLPLLVSL